jgi:hypothetical protein
MHVATPTGWRPMRHRRRRELHGMRPTLHIEAVAMVQTEGAAAVACMEGAVTSACIEGAMALMEGGMRHGMARDASA